MIRGNKNKTKVSKTETKGFVRGSKTKKKTVKKFKRKEKAIKAPKMPNKFLGGFLPFPPKDCPKKDHSVLCYGIIWIDLSICHSCAKIKECNTRKEHLSKLKEQRKEYFNNKYPKKEE
jgi:hypothetical protein